MLYAKVPPPSGDSAGGRRRADTWEKEEARVGPSGASDSSVYIGATLAQ